VTNAQGIENVYLGSYGNIKGPGVYDLLMIRNPELAASLRDNIRSSVSLSQLVKAPFEAEIFSNDGGIARLEAVIKSLTDQGTTIAEAASEFGFSIDPTDI